MKTSPILPVEFVASFISEARDAELCRDIRSSRGLFSQFWSDISIDPDLNGFEGVDRAEIRRLCGVLLSEYGHSTNMPNYQVRARDLLTLAGEEFEILGLRDKAAEVGISLAFSYWYSGEVEEYDAVLEGVENEFDYATHAVGLKAKINRMIVHQWRGNYDAAFAIAKQIEVPASNCADVRIRVQFYNTAGIAYRSAGDFTRSVEFLQIATDLSKSFDGYMFAGMNLNCLAMTWRAAGDLDRAHRAVAEAIDIFATMRYFGWLAHAFDTLALIYLDERAHSAALSAINQAVDMFSRGEDAAGLADAMWNKVRCLFRLERTADAIVLFSDLSKIIKTRIGESAFKRYSALLDQEIYVRKGFPLPDEVAGFKKTIVRNALARNKGEVVRSSKELGVSHQALSEMLNKQFPELYSELHISRRARRSTRGKKQDPSPRSICLFDGSDLKYTLPVNPGNSHVRFFHIGPEISRGLGVAGENVVAIVLDVPPWKGMTVLYTYRDNFHIGEIIREENTGLLAIALDDGFYLFIDDVNVIGMPIAYAAAKEVTGNSDSFVNFNLMPLRRRSGN